MLTAFEELILLCKSDIPRKYIKDAIACYNIASYKSCIILTWIALIFDIIEKIKELSMVGDQQAKQLESTFTNIQEQIAIGDPEGIVKGLKFEKELLTVAKTLELIDIYQFEELSRLMQDRHKCAHPAFCSTGLPFEPTAELARTHLKSTVDYVIGQPPTQGKTAYNLIEQILLSNYFPKEADKMIEELKNSPLQRARNNLVKKLVDTIFFDIFFKNKKFNNPYKILVAISSFYHDIVAQRLLFLIKKQFNRYEDINVEALIFPKEDLNCYRILLFFVEIKDLDFNNLEANHKERLRNFILRGHYILVGDFIAKKSNYQIEYIEECVCIFINSLTTDKAIDIINNIYEKNNFFQLIKTKIIQEYISANNWYLNNDIVNNILHPYFKFLLKEEMKKIKDFIIYDDNIKSSNSISIVIFDLYMNFCSNIDEKKLLDAELNETSLKKYVIEDPIFLFNKKQQQLFN